MKSMLEYSTDTHTLLFPRWPSDFYDWLVREGVEKCECTFQDYLHLKWHVVYPGLATSGKMFVSISLQNWSIPTYWKRSHNTDDSFILIYSNCRGSSLMWGRSYWHFSENCCSRVGPGKKNSPTVAHANRKRRWKWAPGAWGYNWATRTPKGT